MSPYLAVSRFYLYRQGSETMTSARQRSFEHLELMCDERGLFEQARGTISGKEHGYCTDDNARLLVITSREPNEGVAQKLNYLGLNFVLDAFDDEGNCRNRMDRFGVWIDRARANDCWGRAIWGLGTAAARSTDPAIRKLALAGFEMATVQRSMWPRAMAFAAIGAAEVLQADPEHVTARTFLQEILDTGSLIPAKTRCEPTQEWPWPETRLSYANATLAESYIAIGAALGDRKSLDHGLALLSWLLSLETRDGHLSVAGSSGRGRGVPDQVPQFDQQPVEVMAMIEACARAFAETKNQSWIAGVDLGIGWFKGKNDSGLVMYDTETGGCYDGLHAGHVNPNQGAGSTLALLSAIQRAEELVASEP
jgi:hypothetical protein